MRATASGIVRFLIAAGLLLLLVHVSPLQDVLGSKVAYVASKLLSAAWGVPVDWLLTPGSTIGLGLSREAAYFRADVATLPMVRNVPLFIASMLTFGARRSPSTWWISATGVIAVMLLDAVVLAALAWPTLAVASGLAPTAAYHFFAITRTNFATGGLMVAPAFLGAILAWSSGAKASATFQ